MIDLFTAATHNGYRANIALAESGLDYQVHKIVLSQPLPQRLPAFLSANPRGRIPAIMDPDGPGGRTFVHQSGAVMIYVANKVGKMWPKSDAERVSALSWFMFVCSDAAVWNAVMNQMTMGMFPEVNEANTAFAKQQRLMRWLGEANEQLGKTAYLSGRECALPDLALYPIVAQRHAWVEDASLKHLLRWAAEVGARPGVKRGMAESA
jgi:GSH-dependent disulfide-bond oxidoreductase